MAQFQFLNSIKHKPEQNPKSFLPAGRVPFGVPGLLGLKSYLSAYTQQECLSLGEGGGPLLSVTSLQANIPSRRFTQYSC